MGFCPISVYYAELKLKNHYHPGSCSIDVFFLKIIWINILVALTQSQNSASMQVPKTESLYVKAFSKVVRCSHLIKALYSTNNVNSFQSIMFRRLISRFTSCSFVNHRIQWFLFNLKFSSLIDHFVLEQFTRRYSGVP